MVFSSAISLFFFVPIVFLLDRRLSNVDAKNTWLLLASLVFYSFGQVYYLRCCCSRWTPSARTAGEKPKEAPVPNWPAAHQRTWFSPVHHRPESVG